MRFYLLSILFVISVPAMAQDMPDYGFNKFRIALADRTIQATLDPVAIAPAITPDRVYFWYSGNVISATQGGYSGQLLNGLYNEYYLNKNLRMQGVFFKGLKDKVWKNWTENGTLINSFTWKKGLKDGAYALYNDQGRMLEVGMFGNNMLNGPVTYYSGKDSLKTLYYKNGAISKKPSFLQRIDILKKN